MALAALVVVVLPTALFYLWRQSVPLRGVAAERQIALARNALQHEEFARAEKLVARIDPHDELWPSARLVAGEAASRAGRTVAAIEYYSSIPRDGSPTDVLAALSRGELARNSGRLSDAERDYTYVIEHDPHNALAHERMAFLLGVTRRRWQSLPHLLSILRSGLATWEQLVILGDLERPVDAGDFLQESARQAPEDIIVQLGLAATAMTDGRSQEARDRSREIVKRAPHLMAAQSILGELLIDADDATFIEWHSGLPATADDDPDIWFIRGKAARRRGNLPVAARCFWETVRRAPEHRRGNYQLAQVLAALGAPGADEFAERAARMLDLIKALDQVAGSKCRAEAPVQRVTEMLDATGRSLEACAWAVIAVQAFPESAWPESTFQRLAPLLSAGADQTLKAANLALKHNLSRFPTHEELFGARQTGKSAIPHSLARSSIRFEDAPEAGVDFVYVNGHDSAQQGARMFEQNGGGMAVLDFDADGWPDLYCAQGVEWPVGSLQPVPSGKLTDRLFRNVGGRTFVDVTPVADLRDGGYGQGCAVGDFDNDGFPDLYVANIGRNQLQRNNGDGTFADVTDGSGIAGNEWTASCIIVDLNADGYPDLFDVTYLTGEHIYEEICDGHACSPNGFIGIPDRLRLSRGDGTFELIPHATPELNSKSLGAVAFDLYDRGRPCLFIANDQVPGFFLHNFATDDRNHVRLADESFASGLAFNGDGLSVAGMGIAADDVNGDGLLDFYVTTFKNEPKVLFLQESPGVFVDSTHAAGLHAAGLPFVGWGTQFLDADRDGEPDLVVANGHVDDYTTARGEYHMRPQCFRNTGGGQFVELAGQAGTYFERKYVARGLARIDWNRDGLTDFVVCNLNAHASLVTNQTADPGHFLNVRLHATLTARDAIGSVVEVAAAERRWTKQLTAGDGFMASNERVIQFGLADAHSVAEIRINWPSGQITTLADIPVDVTIEAVEGARYVTVRRGLESERLEVGSIQSAK